MGAAAPDSGDQAAGDSTDLTEFAEATDSQPDDSARLAA